MKQAGPSVKPIDAYFTRNTAGLSAVEFFWGLALPVLIESAFLQIFLKQIGASNKIVGLIPSVLSTGIMLFSLMAAWLTSHLINKKKAVILTHAASSLPFLLFGIILPHLDASHRVSVFMALYIIFTFILGMTIPIWQNYIVKIFSSANTLKANSIMMTTQISARLIGSFFIFKSVEKYSFSIESASYIFIAAGIMFFIGSFFFMITYEHPETNSGSRSKPHNLKTMSAAAKQIFNNKNYMVYLASTIESYATVAVLSFYANFAVEFKGIEKGIAAGLFVGCIYFAGILTNIFLGWFNYFSLKTKFVIGRSAAVAGTILLSFSNTIPLFVIVSLILGISRAVNQSAHAPAVKILSGQIDATDYFAISYIIIFPVSFTIPVLSGMIIDKLAVYGQFSYIVVFLILALLQAAGCILTIFTNFRPEIKE